MEAETNRFFTEQKDVQYWTITYPSLLQIRLRYAH